MTAELTASPGGRLTPPHASEMRRVLGNFCTGVAVVTAHDGDRAIGFTCQSVTSVSLEPPYISFCPSASSTSWPLIRQAGALCVNILAEGQQEVCTRFASRSDDKFDGVSWRPGGNGAPVLDGTLACIEADVEMEHVAGDHTIVVARVTRLWAHRERNPLLFFRGGFGALGGDHD
ncbi:flavin reductase family protein [Mycobacterium sp. NAZ190054]|uniref:flavin reductase family protein n=1 Tax=Mycobacterium sp. NAZ190054 TaxID=1747766 RepID=UPI000794D627|nr:flavin reductase family protein [Mycobacterium sp. NAZ190054]KWX66308.1 monooxygenase [Mycobacterium sp. NAZ190054]